jgi:hypothetical protein
LSKAVDKSVTFPHRFLSYTLHSQKYFLVLRAYLWVPFNALRFALSILTFVDISSKLLPDSYDIYQSNTGTTAKNAHIGNVLVDLQRVTDSPKTKLFSDENDANKWDGRDAIVLTKLTRNCRHLSNELVELLFRLQLEKKDGKGKAYAQLCCL